MDISWWGRYPFLSFCPSNRDRFRACGGGGSELDKPLELLEIRQQQRRNQNQETKFTASIVFGGNATFFRLPAATSEETNEAISEAMGQTWKLKQAFKSSDNYELQSINSISILNTAAPTLEPTKSPTSEPTLSSTPPPPSSVTKSPTLVPIILQTEAPS